MHPREAATGTSSSLKLDRVEELAPLRRPGARAITWCDGKTMVGFRFMICVTCWHAAAAQATRAFSTAYCRATAELVAIISFIGSPEVPLSLFSKERRHLVQHNLRDRRTRPFPGPEAMRAL